MAIIRRGRPKNPLVALIQQIINLGFENFGKYYSTYRAFVADIDDPENLQRVKLIIPQVTGDQVHDYWAFPKGVFYGPGYGCQVIPNKGDVVWVEFEGGQPEIPVWVHGHPARKEMPKREELKDKNTYWFITPRGHKIILNDTKNTIQIEHQLGDVVEFNEKGVSISCTNNKRILVKNNQTSLKSILNNMLTMYMKTKTVTGTPLDPDSIKTATNVMVDINKLLQ